MEKEIYILCGMPWLFRAGIIFSLLRVLGFAIDQNEAAKKYPIIWKFISYICSIAICTMSTVFILFCLFSFIAEPEDLIELWKVLEKTPDVCYQIIIQPIQYPAQ